MAFFNSDKKIGTATKRRDFASKESAVTILTSGCHFSGKLYCKGASRIGGKIEGEIISEGLLIIEEGALIEADVKAEDIILHGTFHGKLQVKGKAEFSQTAVFDGDLQTPTILISEGAQFNGQVKMTPQEPTNFVGIDELHKKKAVLVPELSLSK